MLKQLIFVLCLCFGHMVEAQCNIKICDRVLDDPLLITKKDNKNVFYEPNTGEGTGLSISLNQGDHIAFHCVHGLKNLRNIKSVEVKCDVKNKYVVISRARKSKFNEFSYFKCSKNNEAEVQRLSDGKVKIGYNTIEFIPLFEVFHDKNSFSNLWVSSSVDKLRCPRTSLKKFGDLFKMHDPTIHNLYKQDSVEKVFKKTLGTHNYNLHTNFITRGHLSASSDHSHIAKQVPTYMFYNIMPQWVKFNGGNWRSIEGDVRRLVDGGLSIQVITGTLGDMYFKGPKGTKKIYLDYDAKRIPIRKYYYKIIIDTNQIKPRYLVVVGVNNFEAISEKPLCANLVTHDIKWLSAKNSHNVKDGFFFACKVPDFLNYVQLLMGAAEFKALNNEINRFGKNFGVLNKI